MEKENLDDIGSLKAFSAPAPTIVPNDSIMERTSVPVHIKDGTSIVGATTNDYGGECHRSDTRNSKGTSTQ